MHVHCRPDRASRKAHTLKTAAGCSRMHPNSKTQRFEYESDTHVDAYEIRNRRQLATSQIHQRIQARRYGSRYGAGTVLVLYKFNSDTLLTRYVASTLKTHRQYTQNWKLSGSHVSPGLLPAYCLQACISNVLNFLIHAHTHHVYWKMYRNIHN